MIDYTNKRIILELEKNGRISYSHLARSLRLNISPVNKRVHSLLEDRFIKIHAVPNPYKMGYTANAFIGMNVSNKSLDDICAWLSSNINVSMLLTTFGRFNLIATVQFASWDILVRFISDELPAAGSILEMEIFIIKEVKKRYHNIFSKQVYQKTPVKIDAINLKIIEELTNNGRYKEKYLADKLGISLSAVSRRIAYLLKENIIRVYAIADPTKLGYHANAFVLIRADTDKINSICEHLYPYDEVITIMTFANGYNIVVSIVAKDMETLYELNKNKIVNLPGITSVETLIRGHVIKRYYGTFTVEKQLEAETKRIQ